MSYRELDHLPERAGAPTHSVTGAASGPVYTVTHAGGTTVCVAASAGTVATGSAGVCASLDEDEDIVSVSVIMGAGVQVAPGVSGSVQVGNTGITELPWLESAIEGTVEHVDEATGWSAFWESVHNPRAWM